MQFRILGPLEVADGDSLLPLGGAKQRALLPLLSLNANEASGAQFSEQTRLGPVVRDSISKQLAATPAARATASTMSIDSALAIAPSRVVDPTRRGSS